MSCVVLKGLGVTAFGEKVPFSDLADHAFLVRPCKSPLTAPWPHEVAYTWLES